MSLHIFYKYDNEFRNQNFFDLPYISVSTLVTNEIICNVNYIDDVPINSKYYLFLYKLVCLIYLKNISL